MLFGTHRLPELYAVALGVTNLSEAAIRVAHRIDVDCFPGAAQLVDDRVEVVDAEVIIQVCSGGPIISESCSKGANTVSPSCCRQAPSSYVSGTVFTPSRSWYQIASASGFLARKKKPPMPVTRSMAGSVASQRAWTPSRARPSSSSALCPCSASSA